jgi:hypothetical protein
VAEKLTADYPLLTGQRVLDSLFPWASKVFFFTDYYQFAHSNIFSWVGASKVVRQPFLVLLDVVKQ